MVLLTPVVLATVRRLRTPVRPYAYATAHLANAASLLLPVSNLTNLLAFHAANISFTKFTLVMALPWLAAVAAVYLVFRLVFRRGICASRRTPNELGPAPRPPVFVLVVVALTLAGFAVVEPVGVAPAWVALAGAAVLAVRSLRRRHTSVTEIAALGERARFWCSCWRWASWCRRSRSTEWTPRCPHVLPPGRGCPRCSAIAAVAAVLANVVNNLPATLVLLPLVAPSGPVGDPGGADRGQHRAQPDLRRFAVQPAVAPRAAPARRRGQRRRVHPPRSAPCPRPWWWRCSRCGDRCGCSVT